MCEVIDQIPQGYPIKLYLVRDLDAPGARSG